jgi:hypothetical protein
MERARIVFVSEVHSVPEPETCFRRLMAKFLNEERSFFKK